MSLKINCRDLANVTILLNELKNKRATIVDAIRDILHDEPIAIKDVKAYLLANGVTLTNEDYLTIAVKSSSTSCYTPEDQAKIDNYIKENGFQKVTTTKLNHTITIKETDKATNEYVRATNTLQQNENVHIRRVAQSLIKH